MPNLEGRRILLVEEDALLAEVLDEALRNCGATVVGTNTTVTEAIRLVIGPPRPDAAILCTHLGGERTKRVEGALRTRRVPYLISTGYLTGTFQPAPGMPSPAMLRTLARTMVFALAGMCHRSQALLERRRKTDDQA